MEWNGMEWNVIYTQCHVMLGVARIDDPPFWCGVQQRVLEAFLLISFLILKKSTLDKQVVW